MRMHRSRSLLQLSRPSIRPNARHSGKKRATPWGCLATDAIERHPRFVTVVHTIDLHVDGEPDVEVAGRLPSADAPVLTRDVADQNLDVVARDGECLEVVDDYSV